MKGNIRFCINSQLKQIERIDFTYHFLSNSFSGGSGGGNEQSLFFLLDWLFQILNKNTH